MPIDILFNPYPYQSNLKKIQLGHSVPFLSGSKNQMKKFEDKYLQCKKKWEKQGMKIKPLECVKYMRRNGGVRIIYMNPRYINAKHVWMIGVKVDLTDDKFLTDECNPGMKILTIEDVFWCCSKINDVSINDCIIVNRGLEIETMRLLKQHGKHGPYDICNEKFVIESLNLDKSLKNLTIEFIESIGDGYHRQQKALENILEKKYYHHLENVNVIYQLENDIPMDWFFQLLKKNKNTLKHQFKQLNIAIVKNFCDPKPLYFVFQWNKNINDKSLNLLNKQFDEMTCTSEHDDHVPNQTQLILKKKYLSMQTQWLD